MSTVRKADPDDAAELVRLRALMLAGMSGKEPQPGPWQAAAMETLRKRLAEPDGTLVAFVVEAPPGPGGPSDGVGRSEAGQPGSGDRVRELAACVVGAVEYRLGGPDNPTGKTGYVFNVCTDPRHRRRGYSRACMTELVAWFEHQGIRKIDLRASAAGEPLYASLGFVRTADPAMRLRLPATDR